MFYCYCCINTLTLVKCVSCTEKFLYDLNKKNILRTFYFTKKNMFFFKWSYQRFRKLTLSLEPFVRQRRFCMIWNKKNILRIFYFIKKFAYSAQNPLLLHFSDIETFSKCHFISDFPTELRPASYPNSLPPFCWTERSPNYFGHRNFVKLLFQF